MIYKNFGNLGFKVSQLSFGAMRYPEKTENGNNTIDVEKSVKIIRKAAELGINFFDTHPFYCSGQSEQVLGESLSGIKEKVYTQTKCPLWKDLGKGETWRDYLERSLKNLRIPYIDIYLAHALSWEVYQKKGKDFLNMAKKAKKENLIKHIGFSSHDKPANVIKIIKTGNFEAMTIQYNLIDRQYKKCIDIAASKGMAVVIMGPVGGGTLGGFVPDIKKAKPENVKSSPELALRFVLNNKNISCAISGMSSIKQLKENIETASNTTKFSKSEQKKVDEAFNYLKKLADLYCTKCGYCMPCPQNINIPMIFYAVNLYKIYKGIDNAKFFYRYFTQPDKDGKKKDPSVCIKCGKCEKQCPQKIQIIKQLKEAKDLFENKLKI